MPQLPAHASPHLRPSTPPAGPAYSQKYHLSPSSEASHNPQNDVQTHTPPDSLISPSFTPPSTPGSSTPLPERDALSIPIDASNTLPAPRLLERLPKVECVVRARIPTVAGQEMFLHLYQNDIDNKEHLAIVFGDKIRSRSLDRPRKGETEMDRLTRGAYVGRLFPGRTESGMMKGKGRQANAGMRINGGLEDKRMRDVLVQEDVPSQISNTPRIPPTSAPTHTPNSTNHTSAPRSTTSKTSQHTPATNGVRPSHTHTHNNPLVRIHSECYTGETVWSARCDCGEQLDEAARLMSLPSSSSAGGVIIYLRQEGRGIGLGEKLKAYNLQDLGNDTVEANLLLRHPADRRTYGLATAMLVDLGLGRKRQRQRRTETDGAGADDIDSDHDYNSGSSHSDNDNDDDGDDTTKEERGIRLLTNNPEKIRAVEGPNREVLVKERVAMVPLSWKGGRGVDSAELGGYMRAKIERMGHLLEMGDGGDGGGAM